MSSSTISRRDQDPSFVDNIKSKDHTVTIAIAPTACDNNIIILLLSFYRYLFYHYNYTYTYTYVAVSHIHFTLTNIYIHVLTDIHSVITATKEDGDTLHNRHSMYREVEDAEGNV